MDFQKFAADGKVEAMIDEAANTAKQKVGEFMGGNSKQQKQQQQQKKGGIAGTVTDVVNKAAKDAAMDKATETALTFSKKLFQ